jgi:hypothetical protein
VIDIALFDDSRIDSSIDSGVTSGADPSEWDAIDVDENGRPPACYNDQGGGNAPSQPKAAVCISQKQ